MRCAERDAQKRETIATSCLHFANMAETSTPSVFSRNLQCVPDISFKEIELFSSRSSAKRNHERGYNYFAEKYIFDVRVAPNTNNDGCRATSRCYRSYTKSGIPHTLEVSISATKAISNGCCTCANGQSGHCGHIVGLLYQLAHFKITGANYIPEDAAKTSLPQTWHIPRGEKIRGEAVDEIKIHSFKSDKKSDRSICSTYRYNPLSSEFPSALHLVESLKAATANFQALSKRLKSSKTRMTQAMKDGIKNEPLAAEAYSNMKGNTVNLYPAGIIIHPDAFWLAASPDRKVYDQSRTQDPFGLLEIKCPSMSTRRSLEELPYLEEVNGKLQLKRSDRYYYQIQMQLAVTGLEWCDFFVWSVDACHLETINFDQNFWNGVKNAVDTFFFTYHL
ncbi:uncharacterized protein LOC112555598 [Pomacea canaliculata]|uniref:uncharacterized protein LOC112555598 n=1 Tax=Pomacea canaliculata TaxID=400727 RepID=UPI000D726371|nr:uncharacterized protein LOC112555598 [Pomacea canaliculata]